MISTVQFLVVVVISSIFLLFINKSSLANESKPYLPSFCYEVNKENKYLKYIQTEIQNNKSFKEAYKSLQNKYHEDVNTEFNKKIEILSKEIYKNDTDNSNLCSPFTEKVTSSSLVVSQTIRKLFEQYECTLIIYANNPQLDGTEVSIMQGLATLNTIETELRSEISKSYKALERTLQIYSEIRMWYPIHRDLMCLIEEIKTYRNAIRKFIDIIIFLPSKFYNYGSRYQE
jgi:hypothetical protein